MTLDGSHASFFEKYAKFHFYVCLTELNAVAWASVFHKMCFSETINQVNAKFCGKAPIRHISVRPFLALLDYGSMFIELFE